MFDSVKPKEFPKRRAKLAKVIRHVECQGSVWRWLMFCITLRNAVVKICATLLKLIFKKTQHVINLWSCSIELH